MEEPPDPPIIDEPIIDDGAPPIIDDGVPPIIPRATGARVGASPTGAGIGALQQP
jgi:hypothetical protein